MNGQDDVLPSKQQQWTIKWIPQLINWKRQIMIVISEIGFDTFFLFLSNWHIKHFLQREVSKKPTNIRKDIWFRVWSQRPALIWRQHVLKYKTHANRLKVSWCAICASGRTAYHTCVKVRMFSWETVPSHTISSEWYDDDIDEIVTFVSCMVNVPKLCKCLLLLQLFLLIFCYHAHKFHLIEQSEHAKNEKIRQRERRKWQHFEIDRNNNRKRWCLDYMRLN